MSCTVLAICSGRLKEPLENRTMTIASVGVLIACLLMTGVAGLLSMNLSSTMTSIEGSNTLTVYLREDVPSLTAVRIGEELRQINNIAECTFVPKDDASRALCREWTAAVPV